MVYTVNGTYGSGETECEVFVYELYNGMKWYVVEGSKNVNATYDDIEEGVNVELLSDVDCMTSMEDIESEEELESFIDEEEDEEEEDEIDIETVIESIINGQRKQAIKQLRESETLSFEDLIDALIDRNMVNEIITMYKTAVNNDLIREQA